MESIVWDSEKFTEIMTIEEKTVICFSSQRCIAGVLHDGLYKKWSDKLL